MRLIELVKSFFISFIEPEECSAEAEESEVLRASHERQRRARLALAEKRQKDGEELIELGQRTDDGELVRRGRKHLRTARALREGETTLLHAMGLEDEEDN